MLLLRLSSCVQRLRMDGVLAKGVPAKLTGLVETRRPRTSRTTGSMLTLGVAVLALLAVAAFPAVAFAQTGDVEGIVRDSVSREAIPGASVILDSAGQSTVAGPLGTYHLSGVSPGHHILWVRRLGYAAARVAVSVVADATAHVDVGLESGPERLNAILVSATRTERSLTDVPASTTVVGHQEIQSTPALALDDVVRSMPSVDLGYESSVVGHPTADNMTIRGVCGGMFPCALVLLDDVPLNDAFFGYIPWNKVPLEAVDRVELVRGASTSLFGQYALSGVMAFVTRVPTSDEFDADASYGTDNTRRVNLFGSQGLGSSVRFTVDGSYFNTDGFVRPVPDEQGPIDIAAHTEAENILWRADFSLSPQSTAFVHGNLEWMNQNQGSPLGTDARNSQQVSAGWRASLADGSSLRATVFLDRDRPSTVNTDPINTRGVDEYVSNIHNSPTDDGGGSVVWTKPFPHAKGSLTLGADLRYLSGEDQSTDSNPPHVYQLYEDNGGKQEYGGVFGEASWHPSRPWDVLASARLDTWRNFSSFDDSTPGGNATFPDKSDTRVNPRLSVRYQATSGVALRAAGYSAFRAPNLGDLHYPYSAAGFILIPNADLNPETLWGGDAGVEFSGSGFRLQVNGFQNSLTNVINYAVLATSPNYVVEAQNFGGSRSRGAEVILDAVVREWAFSASYVYTESVITSNPPDTTVVGHTLPDIPNDEFDGTITYRAGGVTALVRGRYVSKRYSDVTDTYALPPFAVFDASASYRVTSRLDLYVQCENLFDRAYTAEFVGFDARGTPRQVFVGFRTGTTARQ
jgi:iron complex outermembrane recepter protein